MEREPCRVERLSRLRLPLVLHDLAVAQREVPVRPSADLGVVRDDSSVRPPRSAARAICMTWRPEAESRLPVGSSARIKPGCMTSRARSPRAGTGRRRAGRAGVARGPRGRLASSCARALAPLARRDAREHHRQLDVLARAQARHEMEELEHEADLLAPHARQLVVVEAGDVAPSSS